MPAIKPGDLDTGEAIQTIKLSAAPATPYILKAVVPLAPESFKQFIGVRNGGTPTAWFYTEQQRIARIHGIDYYEIRARIDSGTATSLTLDRLDSPHLSIINYDLEDQQGVRVNRPGMLINPDAWAALYSDRIILEFRSPAGPGSPMGRIDRVVISGGFGQGGSAAQPELGEPEDKMWRAFRQQNGRYRDGRIMQTFFKHVPVRLGGLMGYLHVFATIQSDTSEIQYEINWHNAGIEERQSNAPPPSTGGEFDIEDPNDVFADPYDGLGFGASRVENILVHSVRLIIDSSGGALSLPAGATSWVWTPQLKDGSNVSDSVMDPDPVRSYLVKPLSATDANRVHAMPITFERPFRFAVHPNTITPYQKTVHGTANWSTDLGGWMFTPLGLPDLTAEAAAIAGLSMAADGETAKVKLRTLATWRGDELTQGGGTILSQDPLWPASWDAHGGSTAGTGMTPFVGAKQAWTAEPGGLDLLYVQQLRDRARTPGCLYYNISGLPVIPQLHAPNGNAAWRRFDRHFQRGSGQSPTIFDQPFGAARANPFRISQADYNPGRANGATPVDGQFEPSGNRPDWYMPGIGQPDVAADTLALGFLTLANFNQALGYVPPPLDLTPLPGGPTGDLAVPILFQIRNSAGGATFNNTKSITFQVRGIGEFDLEVTENVTLQGPATNVPSIVAKLSAGKFKAVYSIEITNITGSLIANEKLSIGRASVGIYDYFGGNGIHPLDDQHAVRYHAPMKALFLLTADPIAFVYLLMDAEDARMTHWEQSGQGADFSLRPIQNGGTGRGNSMARNYAFSTDRILTGMAISHSVAAPATITSFWDNWRQAMRTVLVNSVMSANGLFQSPNQFKELAFHPFGSESWDFDVKTAGVGSAGSFFHGVASRETAYFSYALLMLGYVYGKFDQGLVDLVRNLGAAFKDLLWHVNNYNADTGAVVGAGVNPGTHNYVPVAYRTSPNVTTHPRTGAPWNRILTQLDPPRADDVWTIFPNQAGMPQVNPLSLLPINPASYPTPDDDRFVASIAGNAAALGAGLIGGAMSPLTIVNAAADASSTPVPLTLTVNGAADATAQKRRMLKITGTDPWGVPIDDDCLAADSAGNVLAIGTIPVTAHSWPVATKVGLTVLGGNTFSGSLGAAGAINGDYVGIRITGTNSSGQVISEDLRNTPAGFPAVCMGTGAWMQHFTSNSYFKTVTEIRVTAIGGTLAATEKFRFGTRQVPLVFTYSQNFAGQKFRLWQAFKTITEVVMLTNAQASEYGFPNLGTMIAADNLRLGFQGVGLRLKIPGQGHLDSDPFQVAYALACFKHLGAPGADEMIQRFASGTGTPAASILAAKTAIKGWSEYGQNGETPGAVPTGGFPYEQWAPLLWTLRDVS